MNPYSSAQDQVANEKICISNSPVGKSTLGSFLKNMSVRAGLVPHLINHCIRATLVTVLSEANYPSHYIMGVTGTNQKRN